SKVATAHCNPKKQPALNHNDRTNDNAKTITKELTHLNEYSCTSDEVRKNIERLYKKAYENFYKYCENKNGLAKSGKPKGLQNFTKKEKCYHEFIYEIGENTTMEQCQELTQKIAELTGFTPLQVVIHRDEVSENAKGEKQTHYHAHAVFFTLDNNGLQLARREASLNKANLSKIQTLTAQSLKMERGANRYENNEKQPQYIQDYKTYAQFKEQEKALLQRIQEQEHKLTQMALELKKKEKEIQDKAKELKSKENELQAKIEQHEKHIQNLELGHERALKELTQEFEKRLSLWKNILTFGKYNAKVREDYQLTKNAFLISTDESRREANKELEYLKFEYHKVKDERDNLKTLFEAHKTKNVKLETRLKEIGKWCEKNLSVEQLKEIFPLKAERIEKELKYQRAFENSFEQTKTKRNDRGFGFSR
ncbi:TPA: mobilization protein, partial [Campylobacter coli]|nr:mobilization protein [Campylobacter coli]HEF9428475.1 mobilization protein [Campylobacter coli]HEF9432501.1 mobilization protein [Campylobacter coli]HEF9455189.1 mobilization protein [Campylobacter coli]